MRVVSLAVAGLSVALIALTFVPAAGDYRVDLVGAALIAVIVVLVLMLVGWREPAPAPVARREPARATTEHVGEAEVVGFLAVLQDKGRLVDFLQDDIAAYNDAQVGAAARVVHAGCKAALNEYLRIVPVRDEQEGAKVTVAPGYAADEYRLVGKISGQAPFSGTLMHRGWKVASATLPRVMHADGDRLPTIAPAEVELR